MRFFFGFFTLAYGGANLYLLARFRRAFGLRWSAVLPFLPLFLPLVFAPPIVHFLEAHGTLPAARVAAWAGYSWLGFLFLFCWMHGAADLGAFAWRRLRNYPGRTPPLGTAAARRLFLAVLAAVAAAGAWSFHEAGSIRPERVTLRSSRLPPGRDRIRIAQVSDLHVGLLVAEREVRRVAEIVRDAKPDLLVSTGDLVDAGFVATGGLPESFRALDPPLGKFAVTGNHEFYAGLGQSILFTERSGFRMLRNEAVTVREPSPPGSGGASRRADGAEIGNRAGEGGAPVLRIAGVDDPAALRFAPGTDEPGKALFEGGRSPLFTLYLKHRPLSAEGEAGKFDLQLSGHTHRGQIFPFGWIVRSRFPRIAGLYGLPGGGSLYTSRGTGTWGPRMRFLSPPEVTVIDLVRGEEPRER